MKVGDYVRSKYGIAKYISDKATKVTIYKVIDKDIVYDNVEGWENILLDKEIIKSSPNIIDLIEVGDYVNGMKITDKYIDEETGNIELEFNNGNSYLYPKSWNYEARSEEYKIKSIVIHEQFSQMEYRIGE